MPRRAAAADNSAQISPPQISLDNIGAWESHHGMIRKERWSPSAKRATFCGIQAFGNAYYECLPLPITHEAAMFLMEARYTIGFCRRNAGGPEFGSHPGAATRAAWDYVVEGTAALYFPRRRPVRW